MQEVVDVVKHSVEVDEHTQVLVEVTFVTQLVTHDVVDVVRHCVDVEEHIQVEVEV
jgi:hypothetical protein